MYYSALSSIHDKQWFCQLFHSESEALLYSDSDIES